MDKENVTNNSSETAAGSSGNEAAAAASVEKVANREESLEDLLGRLNNQIKSSDWLKANTADKWVQDNPEMAKEFMEAVAKSKEEGSQL